MFYDFSFWNNCVYNTGVIIIYFDKTKFIIATFEEFMKQWKNIK